MNRDEDRIKYEDMLRDYDVRISHMPLDERKRILNLYTAKSYGEEDKPMDDNSFNKLEARLQKDLQKRKGINPREIPLCNSAEVRY